MASTSLSMRRPLVTRQRGARHRAGAGSSQAAPAGQIGRLVTIGCSVGATMAVMGLGAYVLRMWSLPSRMDRIEAATDEFRAEMLAEMRDIRQHFNVYRAELKDGIASVRAEHKVLHTRVSRLQTYIAVVTAVGVTWRMRRP